MRKFYTEIHKDSVNWYILLFYCSFLFFDCAFLFSFPKMRKISKNNYFNKKSIWLVKEWVKLVSCQNKCLLPAFIFLWFMFQFSMNLTHESWCVYFFNVNIIKFWNVLFDFWFWQVLIAFESQCSFAYFFSRSI